MYKSCIRLSEFAMFLVSGLYEDGIAIGFCCTGSTTKGFRIPGIKFDETPEKTMDNFIKLRERLLSETKAGKGIARYGPASFSCVKCPLYMESDWKPASKISLVSITMYPAPCNVKCIYCNTCINHHSKNLSKFDQKLHAPLYDNYFELLEYARRNNFIADDAAYEVGSGEIAVHPYKDRILDFVEGQATKYLTNCVKYNDRVAENLAVNSSSMIITSLDAGTPETWKRIKGTDNFIDTVRNIERYTKKAINPRQVHVKYILQPGINTNPKDYEAVTDLVKKLGSNIIVIAKDVNINKQKQYDDTIQAAGDLLAVMLRKGIYPGTDVFTEVDMKKIGEIARKQNVLYSSDSNMKPTANQLTQTPSNNEIERLKSSIQEASNLMNSGSYERAGKIFLELTKNRLTEPVAYYNLAKLANVTNDPSTAKNLYYKAFELHPHLCSGILPKEHPNHLYGFVEKNDEEKADKCPLCGKSDCVPRWCYCVLEIGSAHVQAYNPVRTWMYCEDCHHMFAEEFPSQEEAAASDLQFEGEAMQTKPHLFRYNSEILCRLSSYVQGNELLEIGVGGGEFALAARETGFNVLALDVSEGNVSQVKKFGIDARVQDVMTFDTDKKWDVIIMGDVIEHVACPVKTMEKVSSILADDGVLWLSTPNFEASFALLAGHNDPMRREASHKNYFSRESLISLLARFDLTPVDYRISGHYNGSMEITAIKTMGQEA